MEERLFLFLLEMKFVSAVVLKKLFCILCTETVSFLSVFSSDPLFSCTITFCTLIFLYLPHQFWRIVFSPVVILTVILLLTILRLGAIQKSQDEQKQNQGKSEPITKEENRATKEENERSPIEPEKTNSQEQVHDWIKTEFDSQMALEKSSSFMESFLEWNVKAPLEVIYEEYEGEGEEEDPNEKEETRKQMGIKKYPSLSRYYPESDSDSSSESEFPAIGSWNSSENNCFGWDDEDTEGLIEIALDGCKKKSLEFHFEEENLIEIDISPTRYEELSGEDGLFTGGFSCN